jgi:hypothetical protein
MNMFGRCSVYTTKHFLRRLRCFCVFRYHLYLKGASMRADEEILNDRTLKDKAHEHCAEQIEELVIELLRYQEWVAKPFKSDS